VRSKLPVRPPINEMQLRVADVADMEPAGLDPEERQLTEPRGQRPNLLHAAARNAEAGLLMRTITRSNGHAEMLQARSAELVGQPRVRCEIAAKGVTTPSGLKAVTIPNWRGNGSASVLKYASKNSERGRWLAGREDLSM